MAQDTTCMLKSVQVKESTMEDFEKSLIDLFNANTLPFEAKRYVVLKFVRDVEDTYQSAMKKLKEEQKEGE